MWCVVFFGNFEVLIIALSLPALGESRFWYFAGRLGTEGGVSSGLSKLAASDVNYFLACGTDRAGYEEAI